MLVLFFFPFIAGEAGCNQMLERTFFANFGGPATWESTFRPWLRRHSARTRPASQRVQACPNMSERVRMHPNRSQQVQTRPKHSENFQKLRKTCEKITKISRKF